MSKRGRTDAQHNFATIPKANISRSTFDRSSGLKTAFDAGKLVPIWTDEGLPGDTVNMHMSTFARLATPLHPVLDNMWIDYQFWAVPIRLIWDNWEKFNGAQDNPGDSTDFAVPTMDAPQSTGHLNESLSDYLGIPTKIAELTHSTLWHRAYALIWNEWYRDQNLQDKIIVNTDDGPDNPVNYVIQQRGKRHDYFTSCLPFPQKGPNVEIPLGTSAITTLDGAYVGTTGNGKPTFQFGNDTDMKFDNPGGNTQLNWHASTGTGGEATWDDAALRTWLGGATGVTDLTAATAVTINALREAQQLQVMYEKDARGGTRYVENIKVHFGVTSPDARLQRPEFLGGGKDTINIHPVPQTSATEAGTELGNLAAFGTAGGSGTRFVKSFTEHCVLLGFASVRADLNYQQGLNRMFARSSRFDFYWPALANLGEQEVLNQELMAQGPDVPGIVEPTADEEVFGYQERWAEYRYKPSMVTDKMRSNDAASLDTWHLAEDFDTLPVLGASFIVSDPPIDRVIAVPAEPHIIFDAFFSFKHTRPMPTYSVPTSGGRF